MHRLSVDHHAQSFLPGGNGQRELKASHAFSERLPALAFSNQGQQAQPLKEWHFDGVARSFSLQQIDHLPLEKRPVHAKLQRDSPSQSHSDILDQIAQETHGPFGIMNIARSILHPQNVSGLSQMSQDRVIRRIFTMMGVEPPKGPRHSGPRSNHAAVDIYSQSAQPLPLNGITNDLTVDFHQCLKGLVCQPLQPSGHTSLPRQTQQAAKPLDQGIFTEITQVLQAAAPDQNQNYDHQDHVDGPVVSSHIITRKYRLDSAVKVDDPKVSPNQLQPSVGGDVLRCKFDVQKALAWKKKIGSTQSHLEWPPCRVVWSVSQLLYLLQRAGHFKFFSPSFFVGLELTVHCRAQPGRRKPPARKTALLNRQSIIRFAVASIIDHVLTIGLFEEHAPQEDYKH